MAIEDDQQIELNKFGGKNSKNKWSDRFSRKICNIRMIKSIIRYSVYENKRKDVAAIVNMIKKRSDQVSDELYHILDKVPKLNDDEGTWRKFSRSSVRLLKKMQKGVHLRARTKWRG